MGGRASVSPVGPGGPGDDNPRRGSAAKILNKDAKKRRRTNILTAAAAVLVIMLGAGTVAGTYFFDDVDIPDVKVEDQSNVIMASNGSVLAKGGQNLTNVPQAKINPVVQHAVAAAEDKNFYTHNGIDMKGIARAAWNNFTGGSQQGASTITQQYARHAADLKDISYNRKLREAVIARKLESSYSKDQIMGFYLNYIYLGEGRYGIEAAAQGYFGKSVLTPQGEKNAVTPYEAAVLASIIKQPEPQEGGHQGYDPNVNPEAAKDRWEYTMKNMLEMKWITQQEYDERKYPENIKPKSSSTGNATDGKPVGMIMRHVYAELAEMGISENELQRGGLQITTTIDPEVQAAAEKAGSRKSKSSPMSKLPKTYQAAVIGIDPNTGRVLGYYGGDDPTGTDYGSYMNGDGDGFSGTGQSPGSTFKIYTLAAALREDISFDTTWDGTLKRDGGRVINNAGADPGTVCNGLITRCDLETATVKSYNFPFYWIADGIGRDKVIEAARDAGIEHMWNDDQKMYDLNETDAADWKANGAFDNEVAFGQYHVVPLEHAQGVATIVNGGVRHDAHFIKTVKKIDETTGKYVAYKSEKLEGKRVFDAAQMSNLEGVMAKIPPASDHSLEDGRESIAKSGTWEFGEGSGDTWYVGGIPQLAATVWIGGAGNKVELKQANGDDMFGSTTPADIWEEFLETVASKLKLDKEDFPERQKTGDPNSEYANGQAPPAPDPEPTQPDNNNQNNGSAVCQLFGCNNQDNGNNTGDNNTGDNGTNTGDNNTGDNGTNTGDNNTTTPGTGDNNTGTDQGDDDDGD